MTRLFYTLGRLDMPAARVPCAAVHPPCVSAALHIHNPLTILSKSKMLLLVLEALTVGSFTVYPATFRLIFATCLRSRQAVRRQYCCCANSLR
jgi:hypothetical protein